MYIKVLYDYEKYRPNVFSGMGLQAISEIKIDENEVKNKNLDEQVEYAKTLINQWIEKYPKVQYKSFRFYYDENNYIDIKGK